MPDRNPRQTIDDILAYLQDVSTALESHKDLKGKHLKDFPLKPNQFLYFVNYSTNELAYARGFNNVLKYPDNEIDVRLLFEITHPSDVDMVARISAAAIASARVIEGFPPNNLAFNIVYRMKVKNGKYVRILRQSSVVDVDENGYLLTSVSICTEISDKDLSNEVVWKFIGPDPELNERIVREQLEQGRGAYLSKREKEIVKYLSKGLISKEIANQLNISVHTVDTHRRNMLRKTGSLNTAQLVINAGKS